MTKKECVPWSHSLTPLPSQLCDKNVWETTSLEGTRLQNNVQVNMWCRLLLQRAGLTPAQLSTVQWRTRETIQQRSSSRLFYSKQSWAVLVWTWTSTLSRCLSSIFSADHGVIRPPRCRENGFGKVLLVRDIPKLCEFPSRDSCQKTSMWVCKETDRAPQPVVGPVPQEDVQKSRILAPF